MSILVTGGAGFIGSHLVERLLDAGHEVVVLDNFDTFYDPSVKARNLTRARGFDTFTEVRGDIRTPATYGRLPEGIDTVIHLAARAGVRPSIDDPQLYVDVNLRGTIELLEFMRMRGIKRLLFGSSSSVYGDSAPVPFSEDDPSDRPISPYAATKRAGELLVHAHAQLYGIGAVCLRFFTVYGPRQRPDLAIHKFARMMGAGEQIPMFGDGTTERDYTYIDDIVDGILGALDFLTRNPRAYEIVNLGGARTVSLRHMIAQVASALQVAPRISHQGAQAGDVQRTFADVSKAERLFGYRPSMPFAEGIRQFVDWYSEQPGAPLATPMYSAPAPSSRSLVARAVAVGVLLVVMAGCASRGGNQAIDVSPYPVTSDSSRIADANRTILTTGSVGLGGAVGAGGVSDEYRIGPQDQVLIDVFGVETFNGTFRVDQGGDIALPLLGSVAVAGNTPRDLEAHIEERLKDTYMKDPHVTVQVVEVLSQGVSVIGAVNQPGVYQIRGRTTLLEVLALAEGLTEAAGSSVFVVRRQTAAAVVQDSLTTQDFASLLRGPSGDVIEVDLGTLLDAGRTEANIEVLPGDIVQVRPAGLVYVVGEVMRPGGFTIPPGAPMTVLQALAMAEGLGRTAKASDAVIVRQAEDGSREEVEIDLEEVLKGSIPPPPMQERDVLFVPNNGTKAFTLGAVNALVGMVTLRGLFF